MSLWGISLTLKWLLLAVFMNSWLGPVDNESKFSGARMKVIPSAKGKVVINDDEE